MVTVQAIIKDISMTRKINLDKLSRDMLALLKVYDLKPEFFALSITLHRDDFDAIATGHLDLYNPEAIMRVEKDIRPLWSIQILRRQGPEDLPSRDFSTHSPTE